MQACETDLFMPAETMQSLTLVNNLLRILVTAERTLVSVHLSS